MSSYPFHAVHAFIRLLFRFIVSLPFACVETTVRPSTDEAQPRRQAAALSPPPNRGKCASSSGSPDGCRVRRRVELPSFGRRGRRMNLPRNRRVSSRGSAHPLGRQTRRYPIAHGRPPPPASATRTAKPSARTFARKDTDSRHAEVQHSFYSESSITPSIIYQKSTFNNLDLQCLQVQKTQRFTIQGRE